MFTFQNFYFVLLIIVFTISLVVICAHTSW
jgi:hypothetical protein